MTTEDAQYLLEPGVAIYLQPEEAAALPHSHGPVSRQPGGNTPLHRLGA